MTGHGALDAVLEATWPPARRWREAGFTLRDGQGGGKRVSAATLAADLAGADVTRAEAAMRKAGGPVLFRVRDDQRDLDEVLAGRGYHRVDPTLIYTAAAETLLNPAQAPLDAVASETLLGIAQDIWALGGIGPARLNVMHRASFPRAFLLARLDDRAAGTGFLALHQGTAMVHALEVRPPVRRRGAARAMIHRAAKWAHSKGAAQIALAVTEGNTAANTLYQTLGMTVSGRYHYREETTRPDT